MDENYSYILFIAIDLVKTKNIGILSLSRTGFYFNLAQPLNYPLVLKRSRGEAHHQWEQQPVRGGSCNVKLIIAMIGIVSFAIL